MKLTIPLLLALVVAGKAQSVPQCKSLSDKPCMLSVADPLHEQSVPESQRVITLDEQSLPGNEDVRLCQPDNHAPVCWDYRKSVPATHPSHTRDTFYTFFYEGNPVKIPASMCKRDKVGTVCEAAEEHCLIPPAACDPSRPSDECDVCISRYVIFKFPAKHHSTAPHAHKSHRRIIKSTHHQPRRLQ